MRRVRGLSVGEVWVVVRLLRRLGRGRRVWLWWNDWGWEVL